LLAAAPNVLSPSMGTRLGSIFLKFSVMLARAMTGDELIFIWLVERSEDAQQRIIV